MIGNRRSSPWESVFFLNGGLTKIRTYGVLTSVRHDGTGRGGGRGDASSAGAQGAAREADCPPRLRSRRNPDITCFRIWSADLQSAFSHTLKGGAALPRRPELGRSSSFALPDRKFHLISHVFSQFQPISVPSPQKKAPMQTITHPAGSRGDNTPPRR